MSASVAHLRPRAKEEFTSALGMIIFLGSWAMMFSALFFAYAFVRARSVTWPPPGVPLLPLAVPAVNTLVLLASSFTFARGLAELRRGRRKGLTPWVIATLALGAVFLVLQVVVWRGVSASGLHVSSGIYGSVFYALTTFHWLHVVVGLFVLLFVIVQSLRGKYTEHNYVNVRLCGMFWHFVDVVWLLMFVSIYLL
jgi:cytochrome c oxidase subunit III